MFGNFVFDARSIMEFVVIKVKYGDRMRRFDARIIGWESDVTLDGLKEKIFSLFSISPDAELILTYIDEDGDVVHLVDDTDFQDLVKQSLNPVRINVRLKPQLNARESTGLQAGVTDVLKGLPEPTDLKVGSSYLVQSVDSQTRAQPSNNSETGNISLSKDMAAVKVNIPKPVKSEVPSTCRQEQAVETKPSQFQLPGRVCTRKPNVKNVKDLLGDINIPSQFHGQKTKIANSSDQENHFVTSVTHECPISGASDGRKLSHSPPCPPVHIGIRCDGCGLYPISGPRFKSKIKFNYDLCLICFTKMENTREYTMMNHPEAVRNLDILNGLGISARTQRHRWRHSRLDSCFIDDVNVFDGTVIAPSTPFTKIWRIRNTGTAEWPHGTQLICIGGDLLRTSLRVGLEIPKSGVPVGCSMDIAVEFVSPERPGEYISYWRMISPLGKQFGERFWVHIKVKAVLPNSPPVKKNDLNLNLPAVYCPLFNVTSINLDPVPIAGSPLHQAEINKETVEPVIEMQSQADYNKRTLEIVEPVAETQPQAENNKKALEMVETVVGMQLLAENNKKHDLNLNLPTASWPPLGSTSITLDPVPIAGSTQPQAENNNEMVEPVVETRPEAENNKSTLEIVEPVVEMQPQAENNKNTMEIMEPLIEMQSQTENSQRIVEIVEIVELGVEMPSLPLNNEKTVEIVEPVVLVEPMGEAQPRKSQDMNLLINDNCFVEDGASNSHVTSPSDSFFVLANSPQPSPVTSGHSVSDPSVSVSNAQESELELRGKIELEEKRLKELEEIVFKLDSLNKDVRKNDYDLEQVIEDLCDDSDWDPMLEELEEMGFCNTEMNKQLLEKNNGSIMRAVMDLIAEEGKA